MSNWCRIGRYWKFGTVIVSRFQVIANIREGVIFTPSAARVNWSADKMDPRIKRWEWREANPIRPHRYASEVPGANQHTTADTVAAPQRWWPVGSGECRRGMWNGAHVTCQNRPPAPAQTQTQSRRSDRGVRRPSSRRSPGLLYRVQAERSNARLRRKMAALSP